MASYNWPPLSAGSAVPTYANLAAFPSAATAGDGSLAIALDTHTLYESTGAAWVAIGAPGAALSVGTFDSGTPSSNGAHIDTNALIMQSASGTNPGLVNTSTQTFAGNKTFTGTISASNLSGTNTGDVTIGTANGLSLVGQALSLATASGSTTGALTSADWTTFNNKGSGSVTSVGLSVPATSILSVSNSPVTGSGTIDLATTGTSGGIPYFSSTSQLSSSAALTANRVVIGGGAGAAPSVLAAGSAGQVLQSNGTSAPSYSTPTYPSASGTAGKILRADGTNNVYSTSTYPDTATQYDLMYASAANTWGSLAKANTSALVTSSTGVPSWSSGSTANRLLRTDGTTVSFAQAALATDVSGTLPIANGGTNNGSLGVTNGGSVYADGTKLMTTAAGTSGQVLTSSGAGAPTWSDPITGTYSNSNGSGLNTIGGSAGTFQDLTSISLAAGTWMLSFQLQYQASGAATADAVYIAIGTVAGDNVTGITYGINRFVAAFNTTTSIGTYISIPCYVVAPGSTTTYYFKGGVGTSVTNVKVAYSATAIRLK